ncbi:MAG: zeta toxin family protein [Kofleriaceae bacterium]
MNPVLLVIAGPNGSGKTTITEHLRAEKWSEGVEYLNPDEVARDRFGDWNSPKAVADAANWVRDRREQLLAQRAGIAFETVFSTDEKLEFVSRAKQAGYFVRLFYISTTSPTINASRVARRMIEGGHHVPIEKIISRYARSMANLVSAIPIADRTYLYDNSIEDVFARLVIRTQDGALRKVYGALPIWVEDAISALTHHSELVDLR